MRDINQLDTFTIRCKYKTLGNIVRNRSIMRAIFYMNGVNVNEQSKVHGLNGNANG